MLRRAKAVGLVGVGLSIALVSPAMAAPDSETLPDTDEALKVPLEELELDAEVDLEVPWRVEVNSDGVSTVMIGPGTAGASLKSDTVEFAGTSPSEAPRARAGAWTCTVTSVPKPEKSGSQLKSYAGAVCDGGRPGSMRMVHYFQRDSWSGWRMFTNKRYTSYTTLQGQGTNIYAQCNSTGGEYNYRARVGIQVKNAGAFISTPVAASSSARFTCGTGVS